MQVAADPAMRGRVMALYLTVVQGGTPIGAPIVGWIGATYGARWTLWLGGGFVVLGAVLAVGVHSRLSTTARATPVGVLTPSPARR